MKNHNTGNKLIDKLSCAMERQYRHRKRSDEMSWDVVFNKKLTFFDRFMECVRNSPEGVSGIISTDDNDWKKWFLGYD